MKKTLAIILSVVMLLCAMPFAGFAADDAAAYDRYKVSSGDEEYIASLTAEQMASVILDWADREIAAYTEEITASVAEGVLAGFDAFEASFLKEAVYSQIPEIASLDDIITYKDYLAELGGDFANLNTANLAPRGEGTALDFIYGVFQFMADNSETFGKVFRWDDEVFDYGKVGEYILSLDTADEDNKKIVDFYNDYLIGNDIQTKFIDWVAGQMNYTYATDAEGKRTETFDDILNGGILGWFVELCETNNILSADGIAELESYDLRTTDIYTLVKNFVALVQSDNQIKIDTYYNYLMDTVVRTLLKTALGQKAVVGAEADLPSDFETVYKDLALLEEISGGTAYYKDGDAYYQVTVAEGAVKGCNALTWEEALDINFEAPTATIYTGANCDQEVQVYRPTSKDNLKINLYASAKNQALMADKGVTFAGEAVTDEYAALMTEANAKALSDSFGITVAQGEEIISELKLSFAEIEAAAEKEALEFAKTMAKGALEKMGMDATLATVEAVDIVISYEGYATEDEFICNVVVSDPKVTLGGSLASFAQSAADSAAATAVGTYVDNPVATVVVDGLSGNLDIDDAKALLEFLDTDFAINASLLDFTANYDAYNGVVGQANHILYGLVNMLVSDSGMAELALTDGNNDNFTANLQKICDKAESMMAAAEEILNDEGLQEMITTLGIDLSALVAELPLDILYDIDFSSVEGLWVSVITLGLDLIDDGTNELIADIHAEIGELENLDAMAVAMIDYLLAKCIPELNNTLAANDIDFALTVPAETDAAAVADGAGKEIIMTKLVDLLYEAAVDGVALINAIANELIGHVEGETNLDLPTVAFQLKVEKGDTWQATLAALVNRVYELADGIIIACDNNYTDTFDKIAAVANAILPLGSLASNCKSDNFAFDVNKVLGFIFDDGLEGDLDGFLRLFETKEKTQDVAADCSVTEALIEASEHIVDSIFPDTVKAELYVNLEDYSAVSFTETTVQEYFTSAENDALIASNNMDSINARKADLVPAALNLVREAGILPFFAACKHTGETKTVAGVAATCKEEGKEDSIVCAECGYVISGGGVIKKLAHSYTSKVTAPTCTAKGYTTYTCSGCGDSYVSDYVNATGHSMKVTKNATCTATGTKTCQSCGATETIAKTAHTYGAWTQTVAPTCEKEGTEAHSCTVCKKTETRSVAKTAHTDADEDNACDVCGKEIDSSFGAKIKAFFQKIINWFKNLFNF